MPSYQGYNRRLNWLSAAFAPLVEEALAEVDGGETRREAVRIADSVPIMMAKQKRSSQALVASGFADKGYGALKDTFFYGVKLHVVAGRRPHAMPLPRRAGLPPGSANDFTALQQALPEIKGGELYGDKAYCDAR